MRLAGMTGVSNTQTSSPLFNYRFGRTDDTIKLGLGFQAVERKRSWAVNPRGAKLAARGIHLQISTGRSEATSRARFQHSHGYP